jgi:pteridine reductase
MQDKVALITGASRRIGAEIARTLHHAGMNLCLHYRSSEAEAQQLADELLSIRQDSVITLSMDLRQTDQLESLIQQASSKWGRLDALVNNASVFYPTPVDQISENDWDLLMESNLKAPLFLSKAAAPELSRQGGSIINIIDIYAERPRKDYVVYSMSKAGLLAMTKSLARELAPDIRVNGVAPGAILWPENENDEQGNQEILDKTALKRSGEPKDIANAVLFLLRDAPYITGQMLPVDGGRLLNI